MTERRQAASSLDTEKTQRLHVCSRIKELQGSCEYLSKERDELSEKLAELSKIVDRLIDEKRDNRYDPHLEIDLSTYRVNRAGANTKQESSISQVSTATRKPTVSNLDSSSLSSISTRDDFSRGPPSHAFKMRLSQCLDDIDPKINKIASLTDHLCSEPDYP